jgi:hypothetical protein
MDSMTINIQGYDVLIDTEDYQKIMDNGPWYIKADHHKTYIAHSINETIGTKHTARTVFLHRYLMNPPKSLQVDHINGETFDNRKCNLRICTHAENQRNKSKSKRNISGYKGVSFSKTSGKWYARIVKDRKIIYLGQFSTPEEAHSAYCEAVKKYHGEFGRTA